MSLKPECGHIDIMQTLSEACSKRTTRTVSLSMVRPVGQARERNWERSRMMLAYFARSRLSNSVIETDHVCGTPSRWHYCQRCISLVVPTITTTLRTCCYRLFADQRCSMNRESSSSSSGRRTEGVRMLAEA